MVVLQTDPTTYQYDLTDAGRGVDPSEQWWWDYRVMGWLDFPVSGPDAPLRFDCTFKYYHHDSGPTTYTVVVRANPVDFQDHDAVRSVIVPYLESLGRIPEIGMGSFRTLTVNGGGGNAHAGAGNGDITMNLGFTIPERRGEVFLHESVHISVQPFLSWTAYSEVIEKDCNDFFSSYAAEHPQREGMAESFVIYYGLRFRDDRLGTALSNEIVDVGPNRMKFFYDHTEAFLSHPPITEPAGASELPSPRPLVGQLPTLPSLSRDECVAAYVADAEYLASMGLEEPLTILPAK